MSTDPGQTSPVNDREPEIAARLSATVKAWRQEMFASADKATDNVKTKGQAKAVAGNVVDPRPIPVGYREFPITMLPARDGGPRGGVRAKRSGLAHLFQNRRGLVRRIQVLSNLPAANLPSSFTFRAS